MIRSTPSASSQFYNSAHPPEKHGSFRTLMLGCIGVVYGDIGTSPLYAFREAAHQIAPGGMHESEVYGILSLILWALIVVVTVKYVLFLLYINNRGEGGMLSLTALAQKAVEKRTGFIFFLGMLGAALFYSDAAFTPAISVISAVEGVKLVAPALEPFILPIAILILVALFAIQKHGTGKVSALFGPVTLVWFLLLGGIGLVHILENPRILLCFSPHYAISFLLHHETISLAVLGAVFLAITGAEALYEDLGHFGRKPIQTAWLFVIFPCLALNYMGQGALILSRPETVDNPFYRMVPEWGVLPLTAMATIATIIASQAVITGAYSLTRQAIQLGFLPRMEIVHTSEERSGQIYMPKINRYLLLAVLLLCAVFGSSSNLAQAYGFAIAGTFVVTSALIFMVTWKVWGRKIGFAIALITPFLIVELVFLSANLFKLLHGGIVSLSMAAFLVLLMSIWVRGTRYLYVTSRRQSIPLNELLTRLERDKPAIVPGTAVFLTSDSQSTPIALLQNLKHNKVLHERNIILTIVTIGTPKVNDSHRIVVEEMSPAVTSVILHFGYMETPDVPRVLRAARQRGNLDAVDLDQASYFLGRRTIIADGGKGLPEWQDRLYITMARAAANATDFFRIPPGNVVEMGVQMAI